MTAASFLKDIRRDDVPILQHCIVDNNIEVLDKLVKLSYFNDLVNLEFNEEGWTPLL